jgi:hypothetical protein
MRLYLLQCFKAVAMKQIKLTWRKMMKMKVMLIALLLFLGTGVLLAQSVIIGYVEHDDFVISYDYGFWPYLGIEVRITYNSSVVKTLTTSATSATWSAYNEIPSYMGPNRWYLVEWRKKISSVLWGSWTTATNGSVNTLAYRPTLTNPSNGATTQSNNVTIEWNLSTNGRDYFIYRGPSSSNLSLITSISSTSTSYTFSNLSWNTTYYWSVRSTNDNGVQSADNLVRYFTTPGTPSAPTGVSGNTITATSFLANWNTSTYASKYYLDVSTQSNFSSFVSGFNNKDVGNVTSYSVTGLSNGTLYYFRVRAYNGAGTSSNSSSANITTLPGAPSLNTPADLSIDIPLNASLSWTSPGGVLTGYKVYFGTNNPPTNMVNGTTTTNTSYAPSGLQYGTTYYWRIIAYNGSGNSAYSVTRSFVTTPPLPGAPSLNSPAHLSTSVSTSPQLSWSSPGGTVSGYKVYFGSDNPPTNILNGATTANMYYDISSLDYNTTYYWRVVAYNQTGDGISSLTREFETIYPDLLDAPVLSWPANSSIGVSLSPSLTWYAIDGIVSGYHVYFGKDNPPTSILNGTSTTNTIYNLSDLEYGTTYYWCVDGYNASGNGAISDIRTFDTVNYYSEPLEPVVPDTGGPIIPEILFPDLVGDFTPPNVSTDWAPTGTGLTHVGLYLSLTGGSPLQGRKVVVNPGLGFIPEQLAWRMLPDLSWNVEPKVTLVDPWTSTYTYFYMPTVKADGDIEIVFPAEEGQTLPVTLSSFTATFSNETFVTLKWVVESETEHAGYNVLRSEFNNLSSAYRVNLSMITQGSAQGTQINYRFMDDDIMFNTSYNYWLESISLYGTVEYYGPIVVSTSDQSDPSVPEIPTITKLLPAYPNPFNPHVYLRYSLDKGASVTLSVYDIKGQLVKEFKQTHSGAGHYKVLWDGTDKNGNPQSSGIYFYRLKSGEYCAQGKVSLIK